MLHREWDHHGDLPRDLPLQCRDVDQACKGLILDLKQRGMLDETLVVWGASSAERFIVRVNCGAIIMAGIIIRAVTRCGWLAAESSGGMVYGETDDFSYNIVRDPVHIRDINATILHLMGIDHNRLTYGFQGLDQKLTGTGCGRLSGQGHPRMSGPSEMSQFIGRLHPLLVHLPIGLIVLLAILEILSRVPRFKHANGSSRLILILAAPLSLFTVLCGWLLSRTGSYGADLLQWHFWTGIATAVGCCLAAILHFGGAQRLYQLTLFLTMAVLVVASHFGGSLTHGSDYLVRYAPGPIRFLLRLPPNARQIATKPKPIMDMEPFSDVVHPVLQQNCLSCHGPEKAEGELRLDSLVGLMKGGKSGAAFVSGKAADSLLMKRLRLALNEKEHMPPEGKPQPSPEEVSLLRWWIEIGAPTNKTIASLKPPVSVMRNLQARFTPSVKTGALARIAPPPDLKTLQPMIQQLTEELGITFEPLAPADPWLQCNASIAGSTFGDTELARLTPLAANIRWLDLGGTQVTDAGLPTLMRMTNLTRLHLERTKLTDAGLAKLAALNELEYLNLYGTEISDAGIENLQGLPKLRQLYLWRTKVSPAAAATFKDSRIDQDQIQRWQEEIAQLEKKIQGEQFALELGITTNSPTSKPVAAINTICPVSGKAIDPTKTVVHEGRVIAFCCDDCKAQFEKDPKAFTSKLPATEVKAAAKSN